MTLKIETEKINLFFVKLSWDTIHFGFECYKLMIQVNNDLEKISKSEILVIKKEMQAIINANKIKFVFADVDAANIALNNLVKQLQFNQIVNWLDCFIDTKKLPKIEPDLTLDNCSFDEINNFAQLMSTDYYKGGRFYMDANFDVNKVNEMYEKLVHNSYNNKDLIITLRTKEKNQIIGALFSKKVVPYEHYNNLQVAHLRMIMIDPKYRSKGVGAQVFERGINYLQDKCDLIVGGLESNNIPSLNLHHKLDFKYNYSHNAYHFWSK
jgi:GNAT superfamily N-acetyltransferase